jgi:hypothetical protein
MSLINEQLYPLADEAARAAIVANARAELADTGAAAFPDFVNSDALAEMVAEAQSKRDRTYRRDQMLGINAQGPLAEIDDPELRSRTSPYRMWILGSDLLEPDGAIRALYQAPELIELARDALGIEELHPTADPLINVNLTYMEEGDQHGWHFDGNDFVISLLLQAPEEGGLFEFAPNADVEPLAEVHRIVDGASTRIRREKVKAGTLLLFRGRRALHRVSPVGGERQRIVALLSYHTTPGFTYPDEVKRNGLGRDK